MEVDGPQSPDPQHSKSMTSDNSKTKSPINAMQIDCDASKLSDKCKGLLKNLENYKDTDNDENIQIAILMHNFYENNLYVQMKLFDFYTNVRQLDLACSLFSKLIKFYSFTDTSLFDKHMTCVANAIVYKNLNINLCDYQDIELIDFYFDLFKMQSVRTQEKYIAQMLDKYRLVFSFARLASGTTNASDSKQALKDAYTCLLANENSFFSMKYLIQLYPKHITVYGVQLVDSLLHVEKQLVCQTSQQQSANSNDKSASKTGACHDGDDDTHLANKRSLNLFRKVAVIDLICDFIGQTEKLDNKNFYRFIEKSLEFFCKLSLYTMDAVPFGAADSFMFKFQNMDLFKVNFETRDESTRCM
jgi:hypothetical protein